MKEAPLGPTVIAIGIMLMAGCAGLERAPQQRPPAAAPTEGALSIERQASPAATPDGSSPSLTAQGGVLATAPVTRTSDLSEPASAGGHLAKPALSASAPAKPAPSPPPAAPVPKTPPPASQVVKPAPPPSLDLKSLETRLKDTKAIGVFTKLALKNQIDDLLERFRDFYQGRVKTSLAELRRSFDMLVMKTLALLQDADPPLAGALSSSRESLWGVLSDPAKFKTI
jgi:hypothetical protein